MNRFKQAVRIGRNVTDIMALPPVMGCRKVNTNPVQVVYTLFGDTEAPHLQWGDTVLAREGDWLCEDYQGRWHLLTDEEYHKTIKNETNL